MWNSGSRGPPPVEPSHRSGSCGAAAGTHAGRPSLFRRRYLRRPARSGHPGVASQTPRPFPCGSTSLGRTSAACLKTQGAHHKQFSDRAPYFVCSSPQPRRGSIFTYTRRRQPRRRRIDFTDPPHFYILAAPLQAPDRKPEQRNPEQPTGTTATVRAASPSRANAVARHAQGPPLGRLLTRRSPALVTANTLVFINPCAPTCFRTPHPRMYSLHLCIRAPRASQVSVYSRIEASRLPTRVLGLFFVFTYRALSVIWPTPASTHIPMGRRTQLSGRGTSHDGLGARPGGPGHRPRLQANWRTVPVATRTAGLRDQGHAAQQFSGRLAKGMGGAHYHVATLFDVPGRGSGTPILTPRATLSALRL